jgi:hypothetical protein
MARAMGMGDAKEHERNAKKIRGEGIFFRLRRRHFFGERLLPFCQLSAHSRIILKGPRANGHGGADAFMNTEKFTGKARAYAAARPGYPDVVTKVFSERVDLLPRREVRL